MTWSVGGPDLLQPPRFLRRGRSPKSAISELGFYEAAVSELTQPAISGPSTTSKTELLSGRFQFQQKTIVDTKKK